jgi:hypothetical protein
MVIIDPRTGVAQEMPRDSINDDDWYLYDRETDSIVADGGPKQRPDHTQTPRGLEWIRGKKLKFSMK